MRINMLFFLHACAVPLRPITPLVPAPLLVLSTKTSCIKQVVDQCRTYATCHSTFQLDRCCDATLQAVVLVTTLPALPFPAAVTGFVAAAVTGFVAAAAAAVH